MPSTSSAASSFRAWLSGRPRSSLSPARRASVGERGCCSGALDPAAVPCAHARSWARAAWSPRQTTNHGSCFGPCGSGRWRSMSLRYWIRPRWSGSIAWTRRNRRGPWSTEILRCSPPPLLLLLLRRCGLRTVAHAARTLVVPTLSTDAEAEPRELRTLESRELG